MKCDDIILNMKKLVLSKCSDRIKEEKSKPKETFKDSYGITLIMKRKYNL